MSNTENTDPGRIRTPAAEVYGIRMTLPPEDTFALVLGEDAEMFRWYADEAARDAAYEELQREHLFSREGDRPTLVCEKVVRPRPDGYTRGPESP